MKSCDSHVTVGWYSQHEGACDKLGSGPNYYSILGTSSFTLTLSIHLTVVVSMVMEFNAKWQKMGLFLIRHFNPTLCMM